MKIGLFGGTFNPPHVGHLNSIETVRRKLGLSKIILIPAYQNPLKNPVDGPSSEHRLNMIKAAISGYESIFEVDSQEVERKGLSYTIDTILNYRKNYKQNELFLILGGDHLNSFHQWKDYKKLLEETNIVITTRPGYEIPITIEELPDGIKQLAADIEFNFVELKTGRSIQFVTLNDVEISSTELRKKLKTGRPVSKFLPLAVETYIKENSLYRDFSQKVKDYKDFSKFCALQLNERKAVMVNIYDLTKMSAPSEYTIVASGTSTRHAAALAESLNQVIKNEFNLLPQSIEGLSEGRWIVIDYGSLIVHIFYDFVRQEYDIERLWREAPQVKI